MSAAAATPAARLTPLVLLCLGLVYVVWGSTYFGIKVAIVQIAQITTCLEALQEFLECFKCEL